MSVIERLLWTVPFGVFVAVSAIDWWRFERQLKRVQREHEAEMTAVRGGTP